MKYIKIKDNYFDVLDLFKIITNRYKPSVLYKKISNNYMAIPLNKIVRYNFKIISKVENTYNMLHTLLLLVNRNLVHSISNYYMDE